MISFTRISFFYSNSQIWRGTWDLKERTEIFEAQNWISIFDLNRDATATNEIIVEVNYVTFSEIKTKKSDLEMIDLTQKFDAVSQAQRCFLAGQQNRSHFLDPGLTFRRWLFSLFVFFDLERCLRLNYRLTFGDGN